MVVFRTDAFRSHYGSGKIGILGLRGGGSLPPYQAGAYYHALIGYCFAALGWYMYLMVPTNFGPRK